MGSLVNFGHDVPVDPYLFPRPFPGSAIWFRFVPGSMDREYDVLYKVTPSSEGQTKRGVAERQTSDDQCPPVSEMGIAVNDPNPMYPEDSMTDCVLGAMDFLAPGGHPRNKQIRKALDSITSPSFMEFFSYGNNTKERWDNCRNGHGQKNYMMERATKCGDAYTEDEAKAMKFYGARYDANQCLTLRLRVPCQEAIFEDNMGWGK